MLTKIWQRYFFIELCKVFFFFLVSFFFLYSLIDYTTHAGDFFTEGKFQTKDLFCYYGFQFIKRSYLLLPLALLISTIKVLCRLNASRELVALQSCGIKLKSLLSPFFYLGALCCIFNWISSEKLLPKALVSLNHFEDISHYNGKDTKEPFYVLHLKDESKLIYQTHDIETNTFSDVYWVKSFNEIWRIKTLKADPKNPIAELADHLVRNKEGILTKVKSYETWIIDGLTWQTNLNRKGVIPIESRKVTELGKVLAHKNKISKKQASEALTVLSYKLIMPVLSLLVVIAIAPFCIRYTRSVPTFYIYAVGLFGFIAFFLLMDSFVILGSHNTLNPLVAILLPFGMCFGVFSWKFGKTS